MFARPWPGPRGRGSAPFLSAFPKTLAALRLMRMPQLVRFGLIAPSLSSLMPPPDTDGFSGLEKLCLTVGRNPDKLGAVAQLTRKILFVKVYHSPCLCLA